MSATLIGLLWSEQENAEIELSPLSVKLTAWSVCYYFSSLQLTLATNLVLKHYICCNILNWLYFCFFRIELHKCNLFNIWYVSYKFLNIIFLNSICQCDSPTLYNLYGPLSNLCISVWFSKSLFRFINMLSRYSNSLSRFSNPLIRYSYP